MTSERETNEETVIQAEGPDVETSTTESPATQEMDVEDTTTDGFGVDWDTGANVGDTGTPALDQKETQQRVDDELQGKADTA